MTKPVPRSPGRVVGKGRAAVLVVLAVALLCVSCRRANERPPSGDRAAAKERYEKAFALLNSSPFDRERFDENIREALKADPEFDEVRGDKAMLVQLASTGEFAPLTLKEGLKFLEGNKDPATFDRAFARLLDVRREMEPFKSIREAYLMKGDLKGAEAAYVKALPVETDPFTRYVAHLDLAQTLLSLDREDEALEIARKAAPYFPEEVSPFDSGGHRAFCAFYFQAMMKAGESALADKGRALKKAPDCEPHYADHMRNTLARLGGRDALEAAVAANRKQIAAPFTEEGQKPALRLETASALILLNRSEEAWSELDALEKETSGPLKALAAFMKGRAFEAMGKGRAEDAGTALAGNEDAMIAAFGEGLLAFKKESWEEASKAFQRAEDILKDEGRKQVAPDLFRYYRGRIAENKGEWSTAMNLYRQTLDVNPRRTFFWVDDAAARIREVEKKVAEEMKKKSLEIKESNSQDAANATAPAGKGKRKNPDERDGGLDGGR